MPEGLSSVAQRRAIGRAQRHECPRSALATATNRPVDFNVNDVLRSPRGHEVSTLRQLRISRMLQDPLAFLRGAAMVMTHDLAQTPSSGLLVTSCGDAHLANFGMFSSPERREVFDLTDFDEGDQLPFEWDLKRLATSLVVAGELRELRPNALVLIAEAAANEYRQAMRRFATQRRLEVWYSSLDVSAIGTELRGAFGRSERERVRSVLSTMTPSRDRHAMAEFTSSQPVPKIVTSTPHFNAFEGTDETGLSRDDLYAIVRDYEASLDSGRQVLLSQFTLVDVARHVVGVGSVGTECFAALLCGRDSNDPFFLQIKEARPSAISVTRRAPALDSDAHRIVRTQRILQATPDPFLGWTRRDINGEPRSFYIRQLYDHRAAVDITRLDEPGLRAYGRLCAWTLARAHARGGEPAVLAGYMGKSDTFEKAIGDYALSYARQNREDYHAFVREHGETTVTVQ